MILKTLDHPDLVIENDIRAVSLKILMIFSVDFLQLMRRLKFQRRF